ncbi:MAG: hypothetical protein NT062_09335 [Proteobacteria bacterium]|nr:hypothetical protein [Pseudomonadota bacterium]
MLLVGCTDQVAGDQQGDSFGGKDSKADGTYGVCELAEVVKYANESTTTVDALKEAGVADAAAAAIVAYRNGPDGQPGTGDDEVIDDLDELDKVSYVGPIALGRMVYAIEPRCEVELANRPYIDDQTYAGQSTGGWARDNLEAESVLGVNGLSGKRLRQLLLTKDARGRTLYDRVRKSSAMEAFTYGFPIDEVPWTTDAQKAREMMPYVSLTVEPERFAPPVDGGAREISLGTDLNDDVYYDTNNYTLLTNDIELRGRARWDSPTEVRRILIAAKFGTQVDDEGNKTNQKVDIRNDGANATQIAALDDDVRRGKTSWGSDAIATPVKGVYEQLAAANKLLTVGTHKNVLLLEPKAHIRSTRSRYHMNEASTESVKKFYVNATTRLQQVVDLTERAKTAGVIPAGELAAVETMETMARGILDRSLLVSRLGAAGVTITAAQLDAWTTASVASADVVDKNKVIAETIDTVYHEFAAALDDTDRAITDAADAEGDAYADQFRLWRASLDKELAKKTTYDPYIAAYTTMTAAADFAAQLAAFNAYGTTQRAANNSAYKNFANFGDAKWATLGKHLDKAMLTVAEHQIETAGIAAKQLWFDQARELYVPASNRAYSNFMIDTTDMAEMLSHEEWMSIPVAERTFANTLPATKVIHTVLVNELQVELGMEKAYMDRLRELDAALAADPTNATIKAQLEGARFVWGEYTGAMKVLTTLKGDNVIRKLKNAGANQNIKWAAPPDSKGNTALKILSDRD